MPAESAFTMPGTASGDSDGVLAALTRRLLADVRRKSGIRHDRPLEHKLCRILESLPLAVLEEWVRTIEAAAPDSPDWLSLVETLTVHETYFFRDLPHHAHLRTTVLPLLIRQRLATGERALRLWSAGCATGEEPYSLAIVALEALADLGEGERTDYGLITPWTLDVLGTDISRPAVRQARNAVYGGEGLNAFRELPIHYARWFVPLEGAEKGYSRVRADARRPVRFAQHNLMDAAPPEDGFDLVSCRNVLIYFDEDSRRAAQRQLVQGVRPGGVLVLGTTDKPAEPARFERLKGDRAIAYRLGTPA